jgi:hypothetical protein
MRSAHTISLSDGRLRLAVFELAKSLIKWSPIGDYTAFTPFAP